MNMPLNNELAQIIKGNFNSINNLNLLFTKYVGANNDRFELKSEQIGKYLESIINKGDKDLYKKFFTRWQLLLTSTNTIQIKGKVLWRLVVGLGSGSVLETSMTLHHILGVPYIPGTALKGVVSSYYIEKYRKNLSERLDTKSEDEKKKYKDRKGDYDLELFAMNEDEKYIKLFGNEKQKGKVTFLDAYPTTFPKLEMDIMNPHFGEYYDGKTPPADWLTPVPIKFITVAKDTEFIFAFKTDEDSLKDEVKTLIKESLESSGIGAKTSVGYGYFKNLEDGIITPTTPMPADTKKEDEKIQKQELPGYLKNETELKDEYLNPDGTMKSEEEYKKYLIDKKLEFNKQRKHQYEKARKWYEKNKGGVEK